MSSNELLNQKSKSFRNPNNCPPTSFLYNHVVYDRYANMIQNVVRNRCVRRSAKKMRQTMKDQTYRLQMIKYLSTYIQSDSCYKLLLGSEDSEIALSFSPYEKQHVYRKAIHVADALKYLVHYAGCDEAITWIQCCELAVDKNYNVIKMARTVANWYLQLHEYESMQFRRSTRGRHERLAKFPFEEDELLTMQFKSWAR